MKHLRIPAAIIISISFLVLPAAAEPGKSPLKVFILAGQSNMQGHGRVPMDENKNEGKGTLEYMVRKSKQKELYKHTVDENGKWVVRDDVWISYMGKKGGLTVGYGSGGDRIGPEFQFGHVMGQKLENQVLIIKIAWGGKSLAKDFRPPGSGGEVGPYYKDLIKLTREVLDNLKTNFPGYDGKGYEIAGFGWHQGWNDGCNGDAVKQYAQNMFNFINDIRKEFKVPKMPFVIANSGFGGPGQKNSRRLGIINAQLAMNRVPAFRNNVITIETRMFFRPPEMSPANQGYHWNHNAETHFLIGNAMGEAMAKLVKIADARKK